MSLAAVAARLIRPPFEAAQFKPTPFTSAEMKAAFANELVRFLANDCAETRFTKKFYRRLSLSFGHIAHFDRFGFYEYFFSDTAGKIDFVRQTIDWVPCGHPSHTFCDVEQAVAARVRASGLLLLLQARRAGEIETTERAALARLKAKYEPETLPAPEPTYRRDLFDLTQTG